MLLLVHRFLRELVGACASGTVSAVLWVTLGNLWTWAVDYEHGVVFLGDYASAAIVVPAFALGWVLFLARHIVLQSRRVFVLASLAFTLAGALVHRAAFFDDAGWANTTGLIDAINLVLAIVVRVVSEMDARFVHQPVLESWSMVMGALVASLLLSAVAFRPVRALAQHA